MKNFADILLFIAICSRSNALPGQGDKSSDDDDSGRIRMQALNNLRKEYMQPRASMLEWANYHNTNNRVASSYASTQTDDIRSEDPRAAEIMPDEDDDGMSSNIDSCDNSNVLAVVNPFNPALLNLKMGGNLLQIHWNIEKLSPFFERKSNLRDCIASEDKTAWPEKCLKNWTITVKGQTVDGTGKWEVLVVSQVNPKQGTRSIYLDDDLIDRYMYTVSLKKPGRVWNSIISRVIFQIKT